MYCVETDEQKKEFPNIIASFWWGDATLTTVVYGDVYPITVLWDWFLICINLLWTINIRS